MGKGACGLLGLREAGGGDAWLEENGSLPTVLLTPDAPPPEEREELWHHLETFWGKQLGPEVLEILSACYHDRVWETWVGPYLFFPLATFLARKFMLEENRFRVQLVGEAISDLWGSFLAPLPREQKKEFAAWWQQKSRSLKS